MSCVAYGEKLGREEEHEASPVFDRHDLQTTRARSVPSFPDRQAESHERPERLESGRLGFSEIARR
jgi:hypothetical protein